MFQKCINIPLLVPESHLATSMRKGESSVRTALWMKRGIMVGDDGEHDVDRAIRRLFSQRGFRDDERRERGLVHRVSPWRG